VAAAVRGFAEGAGGKSTNEEIAGGPALLAVKLERAARMVEKVGQYVPPPNRAEDNAAIEFFLGLVNSHLNIVEPSF
jgi:hypothetical protein